MGMPLSPSTLGLGTATLPPTAGHVGVAWSDTSVPTRRGTGLPLDTPQARTGPPSPLAPQSWGVPPTPRHARRPLPLPASTARQAACELSQTWRILKKKPVPPLPPPCSPPCAAELGGAEEGKEKFHALQEAAGPRPNPRRKDSPRLPEPSRGPPPGPPRSSKAGGFPAPPTSGHSERRKKNNKTQTTTQPSPPPPQVKADTEKPKKTRETPKKPLKIWGACGGARGEAAPPSSPFPRLFLGGALCFYFFCRFLFFFCIVKICCSKAGRGGERGKLGGGSRGAAGYLGQAERRRIHPEPSWESG